MDRLRMRDAGDIAQAVQSALAARRPLEIIGHGSKRAIGQPTAAEALLDVAALDAVTSYEPNELIVTVQAGAPVADVLSLIDSRNQQFAFEPMNTSSLLGPSDGGGTMGGMVAAGLAGPRRIKSGGVRDHLLGVTAVSGFGETFVAGGKVVKNVTGYDLCKLMAGSWGTLAVMTEMTLKVMPKAECETTLLLHGLDDLGANRAMIAALGSPFDVSGAAHLPGGIPRNGQQLAGLDSAGNGVTLIRLEGISASCAHRARSLEKTLSSFGGVETITDGWSRAVWSAVRDVTPFAINGAFSGWIVWRIVCPPASGGALGQALAREAGGHVIYDWAGGLIWLALPPAPDARAGWVREQVSAIGGHATLVRAPEAVRKAVDVFQHQQPGLAALNLRVKQSFDPKHIFNPGRLVRDSSL